MATDDDGGLIARSLEARLIEYRDSLVSVADQIDTVADQVLEARRGYVAPEELAPLVESAKLHRIIAADLTRLLGGDELQHFVVSGTIRE